MTEKKRKRWIIPLIVAAILIFITAAAVFFARWVSRSIADARPLVLIHDPANHDTLEAGEIATIHATARSSKTIARVELWVDDVLVETQDFAETGGAMVPFTSDWQPTVTGSHALIVRAYTMSEVSGQSSISIEVADPQSPDSAIHTVVEDEDLAAVAQTYGTTPEELAALNPGAEGGIAAGDALTLPEGSGAEGDGPGDALSPAPQGGDEAPQPEAVAPGSFLEVVDFLDLGVLSPARAALSSDPVMLKIEVLSMQTGAEYEGLHCYVGFGGGPPSWYPDEDSNQATDESFAPLGGGLWDTAAQLAEENAALVSWAGDETLLIDSSCVGVSGGGTRASEIGVIEVAAIPADWDGSPREAASSGGEDSATMIYRISRADDAPRGIPIWLDETMSSPYDLYLDDMHNQLHWTYSPRADEEPIDGFRFYLNDNFMWTEPPDACVTNLPYEWFHPPCGATYTMTVTAYRGVYPDGPESNPARPGAVIEQPMEGCQREIMITFQSLETFELGGDRPNDSRTGDVGPIYGTLHANEQTASFDGRSDSGWTWGTLDREPGFFDNTLYSFDEMWRDSGWQWSGNTPSMTVAIDPGGTFQFGYSIRDHDWGYCYESGDPGCDDTICAWDSFIYVDAIGSTDFDEYHEITETSFNRRCALTYIWGPAVGSPVGTGIAGEEPLPLLSIEEVAVAPLTGDVSITVQNIGTATWPRQDVEIELRTREGDSLGLFTWEDLRFDVGERYTFTGNSMVVSAPYDVCAVIDPNDRVWELYEQREEHLHSPTCTEVPDVVITDVIYDATDEPKLLVTVENLGEVPLTDRTLGLNVVLPDGTPLIQFREWPVDSLARNEPLVLELIGVTDEIRNSMETSGYTVNANPDTLFAETDYENNSFEVGPIRSIGVFWCWRRVPHVTGVTSDVQMFFDVNVLSGGYTDTISEFEWESHLTNEDVGYGYSHMENGNNGGGYRCTESTGLFDIMGDQMLQVIVSARYKPGWGLSYQDIGTADMLMSLYEDWWLGEFESEGFDWDVSCWNTGSNSATVDFEVNGHSGDWVTQFLACEVPSS